MCVFSPKEFEFLLENKNGSKNILVLQHDGYRYGWKRMLSLGFVMGNLFGVFGNNTFASAWKMLFSRLRLFHVAKRVSNEFKLFAKR